MSGYVLKIVFQFCIEDIDEDEAADLGNDCMFLESLRNNLATNLKSDLTQTQPQLSTILEQLSSNS